MGGYPLGPDRSLGSRLRAEAVVHRAEGVV